MPRLFVYKGYQVSIWSNENGEPIHVHVSKRKPTANSPKFWLTRAGVFIPANLNDRRIPASDLRDILAKLNANAEMILASWVMFHGYERYIG